MSLKTSLLAFLSLHAGEHLSVSSLAEALHVPQTAVREGISRLKEDGHAILCLTEQTYCYTTKNDMLSADVIALLSPDIEAPVYVFDEIDSTNTYARTLARQNAPHGTVVIANHQTAGRGRHGHSFYSPRDTGLYFSMIVRPETDQYLFRITPAAAVASVEAVTETTGIYPGIKWVNDLFVRRKKIAGILCEALNDPETGKTAVIIGIGINCSTTDFPDEIRSAAGSLQAENISRNALAAALRKKLLHYVSRLYDPVLMDLYRRDSLVTGKEITYTCSGEIYSAFAKEINDEGNLVIEKKDGSSEILQSGEISVKEW